MLSARRSRATLIGGLGAVLLIAGLALYWFSPTGASEYGWFAYAPLSNADYLPPTRSGLAHGREWGTGLAVAGALLISGVIGFRIGRTTAPAGVRYETDDRA